MLDEEIIKSIDWNTPANKSIITQAVQKYLLSEDFQEALSDAFDNAGLPEFIAEAVTESLQEKLKELKISWK